LETIVQPYRLDPKRTWRTESVHVNGTIPEADGILARDTSENLTEMVRENVTSEQLFLDLREHLKDLLFRIV
jgi:hypothetical protein